MSIRKKLSIAILLLPIFAQASATLLGLNGAHRTYSAKSLGNGKLVIGVSGEGSYDKNRLENNGALVGYDVAYQTTPPFAGPVNVPRDTLKIDEIFDLTARPYISMGISNYFDLTVSLPVHSDWLTGSAVEGSDALAKASAIGIGDLEIAGKLQYPPYEHSAAWDMAFMGILTLPTGDKSKGFVPKELYYIPKDSTAGTRFYSAQLPTMAFLLLNTVDFSELNRNINLQWHLNFGLHTTSSPILDNSFLLSSAFVWKPSGNVFGLFLEFSGQTRMSKFANGFNLGDDPLLLTPGFIIDAENGMSISFAVDVALSEGKDLSEIRIDPNPGPRQNDVLCPTCTGDGQYSAYKVRPAAPLGISGTLSWAGFMIPQDKDLDGVVDGEDACVSDPEDLDKFQDFDGCPDEDNDEDGIVDMDDKCPAEPEDLDKYQDEDGCPDYDNDGDRISDKKDKCPLQAEDFNGYQDDDGCPDGKADADKDGVPDFQDKCPAVPEDPDGFQDMDGCPDLDNDKDSIADNVDRCPNAAEVYNGFEDTDGCPDQKALEPIIIERVVERIVEKRDTVVQVQVQKDTVLQVRKDTVLVEKVIEIEKKATIVLHGVNFATGSAELTPESFLNLEEVSNTLKKSPNIVIEIRGHTDDKGSEMKNKEVSQQRAESVVRYLVSQGTPPAQLKATGYGSKMPIASNKTAAGREKNRRIEMFRLQ